MSVIFSVCAECKNYQGGIGKGWPTCPAFPEGIPREYLRNEIDVKKLEECGNGTSFKEDDNS